MEVRLSIIVHCWHETSWLSQVIIAFQLQKVTTATAANFEPDSGEL
jgi:hypothetical protein